jgi:EmrB/QacA subfamily drug resistance transporter
MASIDHGERVTPAAGRLLALLCAAQFVLQLDFSIVNVALATIQRELHFSPADLQWVVTGYALTYGSLLLLGGRVGDLAGHRRLLLSGLALFGVFSLTAGLAWDPVALVVSRLLQGASAAFVAPSVLAMITDLYEQGAPRTRALGIFQGSTAAGATAGIVFGGILTEYVGWRAVFLVNPPIVVVLGLLMARFLPRTPGAAKARLDISGAVLITISLASLIFALSQGQQRGFSAPVTLVALTVAVVLGIGFVVVERIVPAPMVPFGVLRDAARRAALLAIFLVGAVLAGYVYFTALYLQRVLGFSALQTGLGLIPATVTAMLTSTFLTRRVLARIGIRPTLILGLASLACGQLWFTQVNAHGTYLVNILGGLMLTTFGFGLGFPAASVAITNGVVASERGLAGGLLVTAQQVGSAVGLAVLATAAAARSRAAHGSLVAGYRLSYLIAVGVVLLAGVMTTVLMRPVRAPLAGAEVGARATGPSRS